jgi:catechol 2,3-dioxygenase-like lactoylglutathione lyase family enzyme
MIRSIDHVVITAADIGRTAEFYRRVLGMRLVTFGGSDGRTRQALEFGEQKINLQDGRDRTDVVAVARLPTPGSLDLCFLADRPLDEVIAHLAREGVPIEQGQAKRTGARFVLRSVYIRDPDGNLVEIAEPWKEHA